MHRLDPGDPTALAAEAREGFAATFGESPTVVGRAPGRVNLIGEHTDYNGGTCLPIALPHATYVALGPGPADDFRSAASAGDGWDAYPLGVLAVLRQDGLEVPSTRGYVVSTVPLGAGLSSSAALECSVAIAVAPDAAPEVLIDAAIRAEREWVGAPTGGMDQTVSVRAVAGHALLLDFRDSSCDPVPFAPQGASLLVVDTGVSHALADPSGGYAARRRECATAARLLGVPLRSLGRSDLGRLDVLPETEGRRARHVVTEIARVAEAVAAVRAGDWTAFGRLMSQSHASMRDDFENSCSEIDAAVAAALDAGALGARMTGGGFGGSMIALVPDPLLDDAVAAIDTVLDDSARWLLAPAAAGATAS